MSQPFKRALGLFDAVMIVIGGIIGAQAPGHIRIAFGGRREMVAEALRRLDRALLTLNSAL